MDYISIIFLENNDIVNWSVLFQCHHPFCRDKKWAWAGVILFSRDIIM